MNGSVALKGPFKAPTDHKSPKILSFNYHDKPPPQKSQVARRKSVGKYSGVHGPTNKRVQTLLQQAAMSLITSHNQHSPLPSLSLRVLKSFEATRLGAREV